ncbi:hypothetical protein A7U60_g1729 [Sanghuangporus baumii]|uniref:Uncharacterized protein n=1 Tax=Sanghuangporus baumii TaxID=108892 RepID=A0A9Q5N8V9_SANBA|nr:hypothetical protein A7U60_g1729 [Sanghuangporus baumii]
MAESQAPDRMDMDVAHSQPKSLTVELMIVQLNQGNVNHSSHGGQQADRKSVAGLTQVSTFVIPFITCRLSSHKVNASSPTAKSRSISAPSPDKETDWDVSARINGCRFDDSLFQENQLLENIRAGIKYPRAIREEKFAEWVIKNDNKRCQDYKMPLTYPYKSWLSVLEETRFENSDIYEAGALRTNLYKYWDHHLRAVYKDNCHETEMRDGIEDMIELAFETRLAGHQTYRVEKDLFLPRSPFTTTVDSVTWMHLPEDWYKFLARELRDAFYVFASEANHPLFVITFVCEYKVSDASAASRQLTFDLCSAQNQRRALGFDDGQLFGITVVGNTMRMYVSEWEGDEVVVTRTTTSCELSTFHEFLNCYIFLCRLADRIAEDVQKVFAKWKTVEGKQYLQQKNRNAAEKPWRLHEKLQSAPSKKWTHTDEESQGHGAQDDVDLPDWVPFEEQAKGPLPSVGDPLHEANLRILNKLDTDSVTPPAKDIPSWARLSAGSCADVA